MLRSKRAVLLAIAVLTGLIVLAPDSGRSDEADSSSSNAERSQPFSSRTNEERLLHELAKPTSFEFVETPLEDAIKYVKEKHEIEIQFDKPALEDAGIALNSPVEKCIRGVSLRAALRLLLADLNLSFVVKNEVILVTTPNRLLVTKVYDMHDLLPESGYDAFVQDITNHVAATKWKQAGGVGTISRFSSGGVEALIVTQNEAVHSELENLLAELRRLRKASKDK